MSKAQGKFDFSVHHPFKCFRLNQQSDTANCFKEPSCYTVRNQQSSLSKLLVCAKSTKLAFLQCRHCVWVSLAI